MNDSLIHLSQERKSQSSPTTLRVEYLPFSHPLCSRVYSFPGGSCQETCFIAMKTGAPKRAVCPVLQLTVGRAGIGSQLCLTLSPVPLLLFHLPLNGRVLSVVCRLPHCHIASIVSHLILLWDSECPLATNGDANVQWGHLSFFLNIGTTFFVNIFIKKRLPGMVVYAFNRSTQGQRLVSLREFKASLFYKWSPTEAGLQRENLFFKIKQRNNKYQNKQHKIKKQKKRKERCLPS